jgi:hypothetical protein
VINISNYIKNYENFPFSKCRLGRPGPAPKYISDYGPPVVRGSIPPCLTLSPALVMPVRVCWFVLTITSFLLNLFSSWGHAGMLTCWHAGRQPGNSKPKLCHSFVLYLYFQLKEINLVVCAQKLLEEYNYECWGIKYIPAIFLFRNNFFFSRLW